MSKRPARYDPAWFDIGGGVYVNTNLDTRVVRSEVAESLGKEDNDAFREDFASAIEAWRKHSSRFGRRVYVED